MAFDARAYKAALERPTYVDVDDNGIDVRITGKLVPFNLVAAYLDELSEPDKLTEARLTEIVTDVCSTLGMGDALPYILKLPFYGQLGVIGDFFSSLQSAVVMPK